jgi:hypothetical protein
MNKKLRVFAASAEAATGLALVIAPWVVVRWLFGADLAGISIPIARVAGLALIGLGVACWPGPGLAGMLIYSGTVTLYLTYLGIQGQWVGQLLWPAVAIHVGLTSWCALDLCLRPKTSV